MKMQMLMDIEDEEELGRTTKRKSGAMESREIEELGVEEGEQEEDEDEDEDGR